MDNQQGNLAADAAEEKTPQEVAQFLGLAFRSLRLLSRSLTHRSYINEHPEALEDNERLEFLGDAVLDFLVGAWLYNRFPEKSEGFLTRMRAALVGNAQLANFARDLNLGSVMRLGRGEAEAGGREREPLLGSTFEALIGALYLDQDIPAVRAYVEPLLETASQEIVDNNRDKDPKSMLQEWAQGNGHGAPVYHLTCATGPEHEKTFNMDVLISGQVYGRGAGRSKAQAAKAAAASALQALGL